MPCSPNYPHQINTKKYTIKLNYFLLTVIFSMKNQGSQIEFYQFLFIWSCRSTFLSRQSKSLINFFARAIFLCIKRHSAPYVQQPISRSRQPKPTLKKAFWQFKVLDIARKLPKCFFSILVQLLRYCQAKFMINSYLGLAQPGPTTLGGSQHDT